MAFEPAFTTEQLYDTPTILRVTDTSNNVDKVMISESNSFELITESGNTIVTEADQTIINDIKVYVRKDNGEYLVPSGVTTDYVEMPITAGYVDLDILDKDYALEVSVDFSSIGNPLVAEDNNTQLITESGNPLISE